MHGTMAILLLGNISLYLVKFCTGGPLILAGGCFGVCRGLLLEGGAEKPSLSCKIVGILVYNG